MRKFVFVAAAAAIWMPAHAETQNQNAEATAESDTQTSTNTIVCHRVPAPTGSRIGSRRICKTQREWDAANDEARNEVENAQRRSKGWSE